MNPNERQPGEAQAEPRGNADAEEGALVEGRRPGSGGAVAFDEVVVEQGAWPSTRRAPDGTERDRRAREAPRATEDVRSGAACSNAIEQIADGKHGAEERSIDAPPGPRGVRSSRERGREPERTVSGLRQSGSWRFAVKRSFTRDLQVSDTGKGASQER